MKVAILGGAGVRVPLLVRALAASGLGISEISLFDTDGPRLQVIADLTRVMAETVPITVHQRPEPCIDGARFVVASIREGGSRRRADDEATALAHGVLAQETVGAVGFAMALRSIPAMVQYAHMVERLAPSAWLITFTNPVSIVTQAVHEETGARLIGICDTPYEIFEDTAHALGLKATACTYDYFGLNHLGWLREVTHAGTQHMHELWMGDFTRVARPTGHDPAIWLQNDLIIISPLSRFESIKHRLRTSTALGEKQCQQEEQGLGFMFHVHA